MTGYYEYELPDEVKELGFSRIYRKEKNLIIYNSPALVHSKYFKGDLGSTLHHLEKALHQFDKVNNNYFGNQRIEKFLRLFAELDIKADEAEVEADDLIKIHQRIAKERIIDEIKGLKDVHIGISSDDWRTGLVSRFEILQKVVKSNIPELWPGLEFELSAMRILNIYGCTLPFIGIILGRPAGGKTQVIGLLRNWPYAYYTDIFTPKAMVSHTTSVSGEKDLMKIDMLPRIKNKIFGTPEFSVIFTTSDITNEMAERKSPPIHILEFGLDYILGHFDQSTLWPRTIHTHLTQRPWQVLVYSREEALARFDQAKGLDCRMAII